jgi:hypothetical protein
MSNIVLTVAGGTASTIVLGVTTWAWWKGNRDMKALAPYGWGVLHGTSWTLCAGGILGALSVQAVETANKATSKAIQHATGKSGDGGALVHGSAGVLTYGGACAVVVATVVGGFAFKAADKKTKWRMIGGVFTALTLCTTAGAAQAMQWVPDVYNTAGSWLTDAFNGRWSL